MMLKNKECKKKEIIKWQGAQEAGSESEQKKYRLAGEN